MFLSKQAPTYIHSFPRGPRGGLRGRQGGSLEKPRVTHRGTQGGPRGSQKIKKKKLFSGQKILVMGGGGQKFLEPAELEPSELEPELEPELVEPETSQGHQ